MAFSATATCSLLCDSSFFNVTFSIASPWTPDGGVVDDIMVHRVSSERLLLCVNASNTEKDFTWIVEHRDGAEVIDRSAELALLALQGPRAGEILSSVTALSLAEIPPAQREAERPRTDARRQALRRVIREIDLPEAQEVALLELVEAGLE